MLYEIKKLVTVAKYAMLSYETVKKATFQVG
jgi:hypothetical protein